MPNRFPKFSGSTAQGFLSPAVVSDGFPVTVTTWSQPSGDVVLRHASPFWRSFIRPQRTRFGFSFTAWYRPDFAAAQRVCAQNLPYSGEESGTATMSVVRYL